jgi:hypothetical protein
MRSLLRLLFLLALVAARAQQLPVARLSTIFPPGVQSGATAEIKVTGSDLEDARELRFSHPGITAAFKSDSVFTVTAATNVPNGIYDARVIGRFGASTPRAFAVSNLPEITSPATNKSFATAHEISVGSIVNGKAIASAPEYFKIKAQKGERIFFDCATHRIDSKMDPVLVLYDEKGRELDRARTGGFLDFTAPADENFVLKLYDTQFRGGDEIFYRLTISKGPWLDFALPAAIEPGSTNKVTLYGRNLPNGKASPFKVDGKPLDEIEVEIQAPSAPQPSYLAARPADATAEVFEYRLGASNPILLGLATAKPIVESTNWMMPIPCEVQGQFFPAGDVDTFEFEAAKGDVLTIEIFSQRLGLGTDPFAVVQRVTKNDKGEESFSDVHEMYDNDQNVGGPDFNTSTRDPAWRLEAKDGGKYRIQVRDLFGETISDPRRVYRLSIRKEAPDFRLIAYAPAPPPLNKDSKEVGTSGLFLRRGDSVALRVLALRRDNFSGPIDVSVEGLPSGVTAAPLHLTSGSGLLILSATESVASWTGPIQIVGKAENLVRRARAGTILWNVADYNNEAVGSRLAQELILNVSGTETAPLAIAAASEKPVEAVEGAKVNVPLSIVRRGEFNGALKFKALLEPPKEFEADGKATNATFEVDLKQAKLAPGIHYFPVYATSPGKYRRITADEAKAAEAELKTLKDSLGAITEAPKKEAANNRIKVLEASLKTTDVTTTVFTTAAISVSAAPQKTP